jgi:hypothetical protein
MFGSLRLCCVSAFALLTVFAPATAQAGGASASSGKISVELNKLEPNGKGCRAYVVVDNPTEAAYPVLKLDLVLFRPDGVIDRRIALDLGPLRADKKDVKTFDLDASPCGDIGSILVNDVLDCQADKQVSPDCLDRMTLSSRAAVTLTK